MWCPYAGVDSASVGTLFTVWGGSAFVSAMILLTSWKKTQPIVKQYQNMRIPENISLKQCWDSSQ